MIRPTIQNIHFNTFGYNIILANHPNHIVRLYSTFTPFHLISKRKDRHTFFTLYENIQFLLNYKHVGTSRTISLDDILIHCKFLDANDREFIKLQHI